MRGMLVECVDCNWQGEKLELEETADGIGGSSSCPRCGNADMREIEKEEIDYIGSEDDDDDDESRVMICEQCGLIPTEDELEKGVCIGCGSARFVEDH